MKKTNKGQLLHALGFPLPDVFYDCLGQYLDLVRLWNPIASLVSQGDLEHLLDNHVRDALRLAPIIASHAPGQATCTLPDPVSPGMPCPLIDIGTGAGFPAIPLKLALPALPVTLIERNSKKVGFLRKVTAALKLDAMAIVHGEFPQIHVPLPEAPYWITARAVEKPDKLMARIAAMLPAESCFLCQFAAPARFFPEPLFHVEPWEDDISRAGKNRGPLHIIRRKV